MKIIILGAGMMGRAIAYDLSKHSNFNHIVVIDKDKKTLQSAEKFLNKENIFFETLDIENISKMKHHLKDFDVAISAVPYKFNYTLAKIAINTKTHFLDLGGNNEIVKHERDLSNIARQSNVCIIPDCGLAPGLTSIITRDIVEQLDTIKYVKLRVGGLPIHPKPPLDYQIVFSPYGLLNEYVEDAIILDHGRIVKKNSMTALEKIEFPKPFGTMEAFLTSGGTSTLPYTFNRKIDYLDYKTIRYVGHCEKFKTFLDLGLANDREIKLGEQMVVPRDFFALLLIKHLPNNEEDVVLLRVLSEGMKNGKKIHLEYSMIDYYDEENKITAMMRTTGYPVSIIAQMIEQGIVTKAGVFCPEEIVPPKHFFYELEKRSIQLHKKIG